MPETNNIYNSIVNAIRGISVIIELAVKVILDQNLNAFESYNAADKFWKFLCLSVKEKYPKKDWLESLGDENSIILLLYFIHTQALITKDEKIHGSGSTIEDFKASDLIFLEQYNEDYFISRAPLILISILVEYFNLSVIFDKLLLSPIRMGCKI